MKKLFILTLAMVVSVSILATPMGHKGMRGAKQHSKAGMLLKLVQNARVDLNLTAEQNQKLDNLLKEVKEYRSNMMKAMKEKKQTMMDNFVNDDFNPEKAHEKAKAERDAKKEEVELHDMLTKEQRQKLIEIGQQAHKKMMKGKRQKKHMK